MLLASAASVSASSPASGRKFYYNIENNNDRRFNANLESLESIS